MEALYSDYQLLRIEVLKQNKILPVTRVLERMLNHIERMFNEYKLGSEELGTLLSNLNETIKNSLIALRKKYSSGVKTMDSTVRLNLANFVPLMAIERILRSICQLLKIEYEHYREESAFKLFIAISKDAFSLGKQGYTPFNQFGWIYTHLIESIRRMQSDATSKGNLVLAELYHSLYEEISELYRTISLFYATNSQRMATQRKITEQRVKIRAISKKISRLLKKEIHEII